MTQEQLQAYLSKTGHPLKDVLIEQRPADEDAFRGTAEPARGGDGKHEPCCTVCGLENECACGAICPEGEELELHNQIIRECRRRGWLGYIHSNPSKRTRQTLGAPDFVIPASGEQTLYVECKTKTGTLSKPQKQYRKNIQAQGHVYHIIRSFSAFLKLADKTEKLANKK